MDYITENLDSFMSIIFYVLGILTLLGTILIKGISIIKKKLSGEDASTDISELEENVSALLTKKFMKLASKSGVEVDETVATEVISTSTKTLIENYSNQSESSNTETSKE